MAIIRWSWLGDHLAIDLANTVRRRGMQYVEQLSTTGDLHTWLDLESHRLPPVPAIDVALLAQVVELRDHALALLRAAAAGVPLPVASRDALNTTAIDHPAVRLLTDAPGAHENRAISPDTLIATLTAATIDALTDPGIAASLALCDAPGCGQIYRRSRPNQQWCGPHCGARARSERAARK